MFRIHPRFAVSLLVGSSLWLLAGPARTEETNPYPCVRHLHEQSASRNFHLVDADLRCPELSVVATQPDRGWLTTSEFAMEIGAAIAINANAHGPTDACGLARGAGRTWTRFYPKPEELNEAAEGRECRHSVGFGSDNEVRFFDSLAEPAQAVAWMTEIVTGTARLVVDGAVVRDHPCGDHLCQRKSRTALGWTADWHLLALVVDAPGMTAQEVGELLAEQGARQATLLCGGSEATLVLGGEVVNQAVFWEKAVANHLGIVVRPGARWWAAQQLLPLPTHRPALVLAPDERTYVRVKYRNRGRRAWEPGGPDQVRLVPWPPGQPSPCHDPATWPDPTLVAGGAARVGPEEVLQFDFVCRAGPQTSDRTREAAFLLTRADGEPLVDQPAVWLLAPRSEPAPVPPAAEDAPAAGCSLASPGPGGLAGWRLWYSWLALAGCGGRR